jgi:hypothetical protein
LCDSGGLLVAALLSPPLPPLLPRPPDGRIGGRCGDVDGLLLFEMRNRHGITLVVVGLCLAVLYDPTRGSADVMAICDDKKRGKKCGSFSNCEDCVRCNSECAWCVIGGLCNRFCHGRVLDPCTDDTCAKDAADFKCMQMQDANYAQTDFESAGGVDMKVKPKKVKPGITEERKDRNYDPFAYVIEDKPDKNLGVSQKKFSGALDGTDPPSMGEALLSNNGAGRLRRR